MSSSFASLYTSWAQSHPTLGPNRPIGPRVPQSIHPIIQSRAMHGLQSLWIYVSGQDTVPCSRGQFETASKTSLSFFSCLFMLIYHLLPLLYQISLWVYRFRLHICLFVLSLIIWFVCNYFLWHFSFLLLFKCLHACMSFLVPILSNPSRFMLSTNIQHTFDRFSWYFNHYVHTFVNIACK